MAKIVKLPQNRNSELNLEFNEFCAFVAHNITLGYKNRNGSIIHNLVSDDVDVENDYLVQRGEETLKNKIGWCFDIVELYREYAFTHKLSTKSYYMEYYDETKHIQFVGAFILIQQKDGLWYTCPDNIQGEYRVNATYAKPRDAVSKYFYDFKHYVREVVDSPDRQNFYINEYPAPEKSVFNGDITITDWCRIEKLQKVEEKKEVSAMAIVFAKGENDDDLRLLLLQNDHREWVFPKGHIEGKETSLQTAIRECKEESSVELTNALYLGYVDKFKYDFDSYDLEMTNDMFYELFGAYKIEKRVEVHSFYLDNMQDIKWLKEERFINGEWIKVSEARKYITFKNTWDLFKKAYGKVARKFGRKSLTELLKGAIKSVSNIRKNKEGQ